MTKELLIAFSVINFKYLVYCKNTTKKSGKDKTLINNRTIKSI